MARRLIKSGIVVTLDESVGDLRRGDVLIEDGRIVAVAPDIAADGAETIDATDRIVMPGFVNAHIHTWQTGLRGIAADWTISEYLHTMHASIAPNLTAADIFIANLVGALGQLNAGVTTMVDWCHNNPTRLIPTPPSTASSRAASARSSCMARPSPIRKPGQPHFSEIPHPARRDRAAGARPPWPRATG